MTERITTRSKSYRRHQHTRERSSTDILRPRTTVLLATAEESVKIHSEQFSIVTGTKTHIQHVQKRLNNIRTPNHQMKLAHRLLRLFQSINLAHEEWDSLLSGRSGVTLVQIGVNLSEVRCAPRMNPGPFSLGRVIFILNDHEAAETGPFQDSGWVGHRSFELRDEFDDVFV